MTVRETLLRAKAALRALALLREDHEERRKPGTRSVRTDRFTESDCYSTTDVETLVSNKAWARTSPEAAARRAGGRRRYNADRQTDALLRRHLVAQMLGEYGFERGAQSRMAEDLGVHRSTISRDLDWLLEDKRRPCQTCGTRLTPEQWRNADRWEKACWARG